MLVIQLFSNLRQDIVTGSPLIRGVGGVFVLVQIVKSHKQKKASAMRTPLSRNET